MDGYSQAYHQPNLNCYGLVKSSPTDVGEIGALEQSANSTSGIESSSFTVMNQATYFDESAVEMDTSCTSISDADFLLGHKTTLTASDDSFLNSLSRAGSCDDDFAVDLANSDPLNQMGDPPIWGESSFSTSRDPDTHFSQSADETENRHPSTTATGGCNFSLSQPLFALNSDAPSASVRHFEDDSATFVPLGQLTEQTSLDNPLSSTTVDQHMYSNPVDGLRAFRQSLTANESHLFHNPFLGEASNNKFALNNNFEDHSASFVPLNESSIVGLGHLASFVSVNESPMVGRMSSHESSDSRQMDQILNLTGSSEGLQVSRCSPCLVPDPAGEWLVLCKGGKVPLYYFKELNLRVCFVVIPPCWVNRSGEIYLERASCSRIQGRARPVNARTAFAEFRESPCQPMSRTALITVTDGGKSFSAPLTCLSLESSRLFPHEEYFRLIEMSGRSHYGLRWHDSPDIVTKSSNLKFSVFLPTCNNAQSPSCSLRASLYGFRQEKGAAKKQQGHGQPREGVVIRKIESPDYCKANVAFFNCDKNGIGRGDVSCSRDVGDIIVIMVYVTGHEDDSNFYAPPITVMRVLW